MNSKISHFSTFLVPTALHGAAPPERGALQRDLDRVLRVQRRVRRGGHDQDLRRGTDVRTESRQFKLRITN